MFMRFASPNERRTISREDLGYYNALVVAAIYETDQLDTNSIQYLAGPLRHCIAEIPFLSVIVKAKNTETPSYHRVPNLDLNKHIEILANDSKKHESENDMLERVLVPILDRPWPEGIPPWRIVVLPLANAENGKKRVFIAFSYSHTLGDGVCGMTLHKTFLSAWNKEGPTTSTSSKKERDALMVEPPAKPLPGPFDTHRRLTISWAFLLGPLLAALLPAFIVTFLGLRASTSPADEGTWTGSPMFHSPSGNKSRVKLLEIESGTVRNAVKVCRDHDTKLTGVIHQMVVRALSKALPDSSKEGANNFVSGTAVNMRRAIKGKDEDWGLFVSGCYGVHAVLDTREQEEESGEETAGGKEGSDSPLSDEMWDSATQMTRDLAECSVRLKDQAIGLLRHAPSIRGWTEGHLGKTRDCSYRVSNLTVFDRASESEGRASIGKVFFVTPADVTGAPINFDIVSLKGGSLVCAVGWQVGALGVGKEEDEEGVADCIVKSIRQDFEALTE